MNEDRQNGIVSGIRVFAIIAFIGAGILCVAAIWLTSTAYLGIALGCVLGGLLLLGFAEVIRLLEESVRTQKNILAALNKPPQHPSAAKDTRSVPAYSAKTGGASPSGNAGKSAGDTPKGTGPKEPAVGSGSCGDLSWTLDSDGKLTISGSGRMEDYDSYRAVPWHDRTSAIKSVVIKSGVTSIGECAFNACSNLAGVTIPNTVTAIGAYAFECCEKLTGVTIPKGVTSIGAYAFDSCQRLASITIPDSVTAIGKYAFDSCFRLKNIYYGGSEAGWSNIEVGVCNDQLHEANIHYFS